jgi:hypothetical protein
MKIGDLVRYEHGRGLYLVTWISGHWMVLLGSEGSIFRHMSGDWSIVNESR